MDLQATMLERSSSLSNLSPKARPLPQFYIARTTFSTKKEKDTPKVQEVVPPKPPVKSCPPISRLRPQRKPDSGAKVISFLNVSNNDSDIVSKHYDGNKMDLYFEQGFLIEGNLGCGSFGKVYKVKSREDGKCYAVKRSNEKFKGTADRIRKLEEVAKHEELPPHPNCVRFYRAWEERQRLYIQIELCQMSLSTYAETHHDIPEKVIWQFLVDLLQGVKHLHDRNLVHMDIKPDNIFISFDGVCKLGDFGLVLDLNKGDVREAQEGDPKYLAPEVLKQGKYTKAADIFSLGMTILELATDLDVPRGGDGWHQLRTGKLPKDIKHNLSQSLVNIIVKMIDPQYLRRPNAEQLLEMLDVKRVVNKRHRKLKLLSVMSYFSSFYQFAIRFSMSLWKFISYPYKRIMSLGSSTHHTSTPKRIPQASVAPVTHFDLDDDEHDIDHLHINDSFSTYNNSYGHLLNDTSSSSSSEHSDALSRNKILSARKLHTEPTKFITSSHHKIKRLTPNRTPPWKPFFYAGNEKENEISPAKNLGPARQKLFFDENDSDSEDMEPLANTAPSSRVLSHIEKNIIK